MLQSPSQPATTEIATSSKRRDKMAGSYPYKFEELICDKEEDQDDDEGTWEGEHIVADVDVFQEDGTLIPALGPNPVDECCANPGTAPGGYDEVLSSDDEDEDYQQARDEGSCSTPEPRFSIHVSPATASGRGGAAVRGRGRGRGRGLRDARGTSGWRRGEPLLERFVSDDELPAHLRDSIRRALAGRDAGGGREARGQAVLEEDESCEQIDGNEEAEEFSDCDNFEWKSMHDGYNGVKETFAPQSCGPTRAFNSAYEAFRFYWDDSILSRIAAETNRYAEGIESESFRQSWYPTNADEILMLFCFWMMLGIIRMPSVKSCFSNLLILKTAIFRHLMNERRYWNLNRAFHLANGSSDLANSDNALYPVGPIIDHLNSKFKKAYRLEQEIALDESLTMWRGALKFLQYIKAKATKYGIKTYELCESSTGYLWSFFVYAGRDGDASKSMPSTVSTVLRLLQPLLNLGHVVYIGEWFNSPALARYLKRNHTDCVGMLRSYKKHVPLEIQRAPLKEGEFIARHSGDVAVVSLQDQRRVSYISTFHDMSQVRTAANPESPPKYRFQLIADHNRAMGGVNKLDQMLEPYLIERKECTNWSKKFLKHLLNASIQNARVLVEKSSNTKIKAISFRLSLVQELMDAHLKNVPVKSQERRRQTTVSQLPHERFTGQHFIQRIPITEDMLDLHRTNQGRRQCVYCSEQGKRNSRSVYECSECKVPLCLDRGCFRMYHTPR